MFLKPKMQKDCVTIQRDLGKSIRKYKKRHKVLPKKLSDLKDHKGRNIQKKAPAKCSYKNQDDSVRCDRHGSEDSLLPLNKVRDEVAIPASFEAKRRLVSLCCKI